MRRIALLSPLLILLFVAGCGRGERAEESKIVGDTLTIYSSMPLTGPLATVSRDVVRAQKLAIEQSGGRVSGFRISFVSLDSADPKSGHWTPRTVARNARDAVDDLQTIAYIGELESGASAISVPILNEGGMLQVSPGDTYAGLTERRGAGEPEKYYPSGKRTFARMVPTDTEEVRQLAAMIEGSGARRIVLADDRQVAGTALVDALQAELEENEEIEIVDRRRMYVEGDVPDDLARDVRERRADAFFYGGAYRRFAAEVMRMLGQGAPGVDLYAADGLAVAPELPARIGLAASSRLLLTAVDPEETESARAFERRFQERYGRLPNPRAVLGYEAMRHVLGAISRAGADASSRPEVIREAIANAGSPPAAFAPFRLDEGGLAPAPSAL